MMLELSFIIKFYYDQFMFTISIFPDQQYFIALYLSLFDQPSKALPMLAPLLQRTKNPPISIVYTHEFLRPKSNEEYALDIVRFVSQLSDLSDGVSVSSSLQSVIMESSLLTEVRHNLTHKGMVSNDIVKLCRQIILSEIKSKFWEPTFLSYCQNYAIKKELVEQYYEKIYQIPLTGQKLAKLQQNMHISSQEELRDCSPYKFKQFFPSFLQTNLSKVRGLLSKVSELKRNVGFNICLRKFIRNHNNQELSYLLIQLIESELINLQEGFIKRSLKQLTFVHYLGFCRKVLNKLPEKKKTELANYWKDINSQLKASKNKEIINIYEKE